MAASRPESLQHSVFSSKNSWKIGIVPPIGSGPLSGVEHSVQVSRPVDDIDRDIIRLLGEIAPGAEEALARALAGEGKGDGKKLH